MDKALIRISKFLSKVLRHQPELIGLTLDSQGWAKVSELIRKAKQHGVPLSRETLVQVVAENDKQRFRLSDDNTRIRASQGHSVSIDLGLTPMIPPNWLFHGTAYRNLDSIKQQGLLPGQRNHVHLSFDEASARQVGARHGKPVVLSVDAAQMVAEGHVFYCADNQVWLEGSKITS